MLKLHEAMALGASLCKMEAGNWETCILGVAGTAAGIPTWGNMSKGRDKAIFEKWKFLNVISTYFSAFSYKCMMVDQFRNLLENESTYFSQAQIGRFIWNAFDTEVCQGETTLESLIDYTKNLELIYDNQKCLPLPVTVCAVENYEFIEATA